MKWLVKFISFLVGLIAVIVFISVVASIVAVILGRICIFIIRLFY